MIPPKCKCGGRMRVYEERSCPACGTVGLHDIEDANAFVQATINKGGTRLTSEQRDELAAEGVRALVKMAKEYQPGKGGRDPVRSKFSGFAAAYLPGKLSDALHRLMDDTLTTQEDGSRVWDVKPAQVSLDALASTDGPGVDAVEELHYTELLDLDGVGDTDVLDDWWAERRANVMRYAELRSEGFRNNEIADVLGLLPAQVKELERFAREMLTRVRAVA